jgi:methylmalonyl-CoA mutase N-terminal domain/subunit
MAAVLGGAQSLHTNGKDEALSLPTEESVRTALRTQQILAHESGVADTIDPLGGSYAVESLTDEIEAEARDLLEEIDDRGGMRPAVESGWVKRQIQDVAFERQREIEAGERVVVGVNKYQVDEEPEADIEAVDPEDERRQQERLQAVKDERDDEAVEAALSDIRAAAAGEENLLPPIVEAVKAYATVGEISDVLREEFGEYRPAV